MTARVLLPLADAEPPGVLTVLRAQEAAFARFWAMARLLDFDFEWVLPDRGPRFRATAARMREELERRSCAVRSTASGAGDARDRTQR